ncbi:Nicotianamine synthase [Chaetomium sp. MPI-SDFR-AT-0129]|nr:Nicotianamine synthase [Chaetomium sp. MPI-SDFR-AT-0129]
MSPIPPTQQPRACDLEPEVQTYLAAISQSTDALRKLYPLDTPEKADLASPLWDEIYTAIGFTTLDVELEHAILTHKSTAELMPAVREATVQCEAAFEIITARRLVQARDPDEAREILNNGPIHPFYVHFANLEWTTLLNAVGKTPQSVAILGSGALPETSIWITDWAAAHGTQIHVHNVELVPDRLELSRGVHQALGLLDQSSNASVSFETGDARNAPSDLSVYDAVYFNATVGSTVEEKESILLDVVSRMRKGAHMVTRSTYSLKTMAYPPVSLQSPRVLGKLRPVLTLHSSGEVGKTVNATVIVSRVL